MARSYCNLCLLEKKEQNFEKAIQFCELSAELADTLKLNLIGREVAEYLSDIYKIEGDYAKSVIWDEKAEILDDAVTVKAATLKGAKLELEAKMKAKEAAFEEKEERVRKGVRQQQMLFIGSTILFLLAVFYLYRRFSKTKEKIETQLQEQNQKIEKISHQNEQLQIANEEKAKELIIKKVEGKRKDAVLKNIEATIQNNEHTTSFDQLNESLQSLDDFKKLKQQIVEIDSQFFQKISNLNIDFTDNEIQHIAYSFLGISAKEAAQELFISKRTVENTRYNLKKKLAVPANQRLKKFLENL